jgi:hypothetical protein
LTIARIRVLKVYDACNQRTAIQFLNEVRRRLPFRIRVIQTDNGAEFQTTFHAHVEGLERFRLSCSNAVPTIPDVVRAFVGQEESECHGEEPVALDKIRRVLSGAA